MTHLKYILSIDLKDKFNINLHTISLASSSLILVCPVTVIVVGLILDVRYSSLLISILWAVEVVASSMLGNSEFWKKRRLGSHDFHSLRWKSVWPLIAWFGTVIVVRLNVVLLDLDNDL